VRDRSVSGEPATEAPVGFVTAGVTREVLNGSDLLRQLGSTSDGAVIVFEGRVRDHNQQRSVVRLHYDAYREMADEVLAEIGREAIERFGVSAVAARHRIGILEPGTVSLVVAAAGAHRDHAYEASRYIIEEIKRRLPVWKKEEYADGAVEWLEGESAAMDCPQKGSESE
jgi:molybdopterin synthase catalytic subunit